MSLVEFLVRATHLVVAAVWVGAVFLYAFGVLPLAREGEVNAAPLERLTERLRFGSRMAAVVLLLSGGYLISLAGHEQTLVSSVSGLLVLAMLGLWLVFTGLVEIGAGRVLDGTEELKVRTPAERATTLFRVATLVGVLVLVDGVLIRFPGLLG